MASRRVFSSSTSTAVLHRRNTSRARINTIYFHWITTRLASTTTTSSTFTNERSRNALFQDLSKLFPQSSSSSSDSSVVVELSLNPYELARHGRGESFHETQPPDIVVYPLHTDHVVKVVQYASEHSIPVIPFGVGTSLEGHVAAAQGGICMDMSRMNQIELSSATATANPQQQSTITTSSSIPDPFVTVGAGVTRKQLNQALRHTGMQFVVDPGADATIGGMTACSASGTTAVLYGTMRDNILGLECVLAADGGSVVQCGNHMAPKSSAGYDLVSLMCGSEGTLGVITKVTVKLHPVPQFVATAKCSFPNLQRAANSVAMLKIGLGLPLMRCELLDSASLYAFYQYQQQQHHHHHHHHHHHNNTISSDRTTSHDSNNNNKTLINLSTYPPTLFLEFQGPTELFVQEQVDLAQSIMIGDADDTTSSNDNNDYGSGFDFTCTWDATERQQMWKARHDLYYASLALRPGCSGALVTDACVPLRQLGPLLQATADHVQELNVVGPCFGHVGDGNFHCILPLLPNEDDEYRQRVNQVHRTLIQRALAVGGTCTGEHGIGLGKINYLEQQLGPNGIRMMKLIKQALDPQNIMNPGKVLR